MIKVIKVIKVIDLQECAKIYLRTVLSILKYPIIVITQIAFKKHCKIPISIVRTARAASVQLNKPLRGMAPTDGLLSA